MNFVRFFRLLLSLLISCGLHGLISPRDGSRLCATKHRLRSDNNNPNRNPFVDSLSPTSAAIIIADNISLAASPNTETVPTTKIRVTKTLGIDYGLARTGLALSGGYAAAQPITILDAPDFTEPIIDCLRLYQVEQIVLGWPLEKNGTISEQALLTKKFGLTLKEDVCRKLGDIPLYLCDERYTSKAARATLMNGKNGGMLSSGSSNEGVPLVDAISACMILDSFFGGEVFSELTLPDDLLADCLAEYKLNKEIADAERQAAVESRDLHRQRRREAIAHDKKTRAETIPPRQKAKKKRKR